MADYNTETNGVDFKFLGLRRSAHAVYGPDRGMMFWDCPSVCACVHSGEEFGPACRQLLVVRL